MINKMTTFSKYETTNARNSLNHFGKGICKRVKLTYYIHVTEAFLELETTRLYW